MIHVRNKIPVPPNPLSHFVYTLHPKQDLLFLSVRELILYFVDDFQVILSKFVIIPKNLHLGK